MKRAGAGFAAVALALALSACGDSSNSGGNDGSKPLGAPTLTTADCTSGTMAISYVDQRQKKFIADVQANKVPVDKAQGFFRLVSDKANAAKTSNDWIGYCKAVDGYLTGIGY
ncbi:hypothetical protein sos41_17660 [Alphaproteobacteria bacterium SO-S41]|nr:hypothetical protein sos41_17660 [Alphaproteobacteria bacterium SO-S41]